jgi:oligopeptide transport system ATP-binding protein
MYKGRIVELADTQTLFENPMHPYTRSLLSAVPNPDPDVQRAKEYIAYDPLEHDYSKDQPSFIEASPGHYIYANEEEALRYKKRMRK